MAIINTKYTRSNGTIGIKTYSDQPSKTNPNYKDEVDVNHIMDRFLKTGQLTHVNQTQLQYLGEDFQQLPDLQSSLHHIKNMEHVYQNLNKKFKNRFKSLQEFLEFAERPENQDELEKIMAPQTTTNKTTTNKEPEKTTPTPTPQITPEPVKEKPS